MKSKLNSTSTVTFKYIKIFLCRGLAGRQLSLEEHRNLRIQTERRKERNKVLLRRDQCKR